MVTRPRGPHSNALREVTRHLGIDLPGLLAHITIGPAVHQPEAR
ncbi:hypothetical protein [Nocardia sp. NPDC004711]